MSVSQRLFIDTDLMAVYRLIQLAYKMGRPKQVVHHALQILHLALVWMIFLVRTIRRQPLRSADINYLALALALLSMRSKSMTIWAVVKESDRCLS